MQIVFEKPHSGITSIGLKGDIKHLVDNLKEKNELVFGVTLVGKTLIKTNACCGKFNAIIGLEPDGFTMYERYEDDLNGGKLVTHFKLSKKQGYEKYKDYILACVEKIETALGESINQDKIRVITSIPELLALNN